MALEELYMLDNQLRDLAPINDHPKLKLVDVEMNSIYSFDSVADLEARGCKILGKKVQTK